MVETPPPMVIATPKEVVGALREGDAPVFHLPAPFISHPVLILGYFHLGVDPNVLSMTDAEHSPIPIARSPIVCRPS